MNQSARQMLAGLPVQMAEGGAVEDPLSAGRRRAIANGNEAGWLKNVASVANKWFANPGTAAEAYDAMVKSGISVKDLADAGIAQDAINTALRIETPKEQAAVNDAALKSMTSTLAQNPTLASEMGARGAEAIYAQARNYVANLQQDGLTAEERQQLQRMATAQGWGYSDIRAAGIDPSLLFEQPAPAATTPVTPSPVVQNPFPDPKPYTPVTVYDADKFAREQGGEDLYKKGEIALDTAFRSSPVRQVSPTTGQYTYTPAAQLRPATGSGWSWKPPVVTSRPRELLDVGPTASASQQYAQSRQQQDRALRDAFAASNLPMSGANTYYWQSRLRGGDYSPGGTFDSAKFGQDFQSWAASQGSGTSGTAGSSQTGDAIAQNQQMYDELGNPIPSTTANPLAMAPKMFLNMQPQMFADGGEARARELLDRLKKPEGAEEQVPGAEEPRSMLERLQRFTSLDTPQDMSLGETAADIGMGFLPGVGTAQGARDFERARREDDMLGMGLSAASMIPVAGGVIKLGKKGVSTARKAVDELREIFEENPLNPTELVTNGAAATVYPMGDTLHLSDIRTFAPGQGNASQALRSVLEVADRNKVPVTLTAKNYSGEGLTTAQLVDWYKRNGFETVSDLGDDGVDMIRQPRGVAENWYHGTYSNILDPAGNLDFKVGQRGAVFLTPDPNFAAKYALNDVQLSPDDIDRMIQRGASPQEGAAIYPVRPNVSNTFDINNSEHIARLKSAVTMGGATNQRWKPALALINDKIKEENTWAAVERLLPDIKAAGFDSAFVEEMGRKNLAVFDPKNIDPAIGSVKPSARQMLDQADPANPVITKKDGGEVSFSEQMLEKLKNVGKVARKASRALSDLTPMSEMEDYASRTSTLFYPKETELGGEADAMRHMLFQSELANRYGRLPAAVVGALNEYGLGTLQGQSRAERGMDLENDEKGRDIGLSDMTQDERLREIMEFIDSGKAKTLKESQLGYKDGGEARTEDLIAQMDRIGSAPSRRTPQEDPVKTESRGLLDRLNSAFFENVTKPVVGSAVDMTVGLGDIAQLGTKYLAGRAGVETEPFAPVSGRVQEALGVEGYDPYAPAAIGAQIAAGPVARLRSAAAPAVSAATRATVPGSADDMLKRLVGDVAKEGQVYAGSEAGAQIASRLAPDNFGAELVGSMIGGTAVNSAIAVDPRDMSRSAGVSNMASYTPYPFARGREYPFVGRLDQYVADNVEGTLTKDQFLGQIRPKFREYDILRAQRALSDLGGKDKLTAADLLTRLEQVYDPADFKMSVYKQGNLNYPGVDNPWINGIDSLDGVVPEGSSATGRFGTISLSRGGVEGPASSLNPNMLNQGLDTLRSLTQDRSNSGIALELAQGSGLGRISILRDIVNELPDSTEQNRLRYYISDLEDAVGQRQSIANELDMLQEDNEYLLKGATWPSFFEPAYREALERGGAPPEQLLDQAFNTAISRAYANQMRYLSGYDEFFPLDIDLTGAVRYNDKVQAIASQIGPAAARAKQQLQADTADRLNNTLTAMEGYAPEFEKLFKARTSNTIPGSNPGFRGQHPELSASAGNQIGFSRFSEVEAPLPGGTAAARGIYVHELQADLLDDIRKKGMRGEGVPELEQRLQRAMQEKDKATLAATQAQSELDMLSRNYSISYNRELAGDISGSQGAAERTALDQQSESLVKQLETSQNRAFSVGSRIAELEDAVRNAKKGKMPDLDESFPGMERNSKAVQQLLIRNAVAAAVDQNYQFVALTTPEHSSQPQLYSRIAKNASDVVKDLGEGFRVVDLTLEGSDGPFKTTAIVWGDDSPEGREAVNRVLTRGVPFAKGGEVTSKPDDIKNLLSFLDK